MRRFLKMYKIEQKIFFSSPNVLQPLLSSKNFNFPMLLFSGATIPAEVFPEAVQAVIKWMPLGIGIDLLKKVSIGNYDGILIPVVTLSVIVVICTVVAIKTFRWE